MSITVPVNEEARLRAVWSCEVLDTPPEEDFDNIAELAAQLCEAPAAMISLVDRERVWAKARVGLEYSELPREAAFCSHAVLQPEVMVVEDALEDERFATAALAGGEARVRFYAGAPLVVSDELALGT